jgi:hypothetical protein
MQFASNLQFAPVNTSTSGATQLVAAQGAGLSIYVVSYVLVATSAVTVQFQSHNTNLTGAMSLAANGGLVVLGRPTSHLLATAQNQELNLNLGGAVQVSGHISYFVQP